MLALLFREATLHSGQYTDAAGLEQYDGVIGRAYVAVVGFHCDGECMAGGGDGGGGGGGGESGNLAALLKGEVSVLSDYTFIRCGRRCGCDEVV